MSVRSKKINQRTKLVGYILDALTKEVDGLMSEWRDLQVIDKVDLKKTGCNLREEGYLVVELRFAIFMFCVGQRFIKVIYEKKVNNIETI